MANNFMFISSLISHDFIFLCDLKNLDYDLKSMTARGRAVEATRQREAHKFGADCQSLKKRVSAYERYIK